MNPNSKDHIFLSRSFVLTEGIVPSLRGKVLSDNTPGISSLRASLLRDWMLHGKVKFSPLSDGTFLVQLDEKRDLVNVWNGGPWLYNGDLFLLHPSTTHTVHQLEFTKAKFWVLFHGLPFEYLSTSSACALASRIGEPMEFSSPSYLPRQVGSMRVQIRIDITKPLIRSLPVVLEDGAHVVVSIEYESLPRFCRLCGILGHESERCSYTRNCQGTKMNATNVPNHLLSDVSHGSIPLPSSSEIISQPPEMPLIAMNLHKMDPTEATALTLLKEMQLTNVIPANHCLPLKSIFNKFISAFLQGPSHFQLGVDVQPCSDSGVTVRMELVIKIPPLPTKSIGLPLKLIAKQTGVKSITISGSDRSLILVIGSNMDPVTMLKYLRRRIGPVEVMEDIRFEVSKSEMSSNNNVSSSPARFEVSALQLIDAICQQP